MINGLVVDSFAGGGGASVGIAAAIGRDPDIAINHDPEAVAMHKANHPRTEHLCQNIYQVDPADVARRGRVALLWASPDCCHHSKAKGGKPLKKNIRDLAWVVVLWAKRAKPNMIFLENVEEFQDWCPLDETDRPIKARRGETFKKWVRALQREGYRVEYRELRANDYGVPTTRKRLFVIARRDGLPIVWPEPSDEYGLTPYRIAADCIDWSIPCPSIFLSKEEGRSIGVKRPLAEATMARIAKGIYRYVLTSADPFIVPITHHGDVRVHSIRDPLRTVTTANRGEFSVVAPYLVPRYGERPGQEPRTRDIKRPWPTIVPTGNHAQLVAAFMAQHNTGVVGHDMREPVSTLSAKCAQQQLVTSNLVKLRNNGIGQDMRKPVPTLTAGGTHLGEVRALLIKYYGEGGQHQDLRDPMHTLTSKARMGLVTIAGQDWVITDIGMRMLEPRELFRAQGFPDDYRIDPIFEGKPLTKTAQTRMCGNSVNPGLAYALVKANIGAAEEREAA